MRRKSKLLIAAVACALPLAALTAGTARADTTTPIPQLNGYQQMVVDPASPGYIFMSGGGEIVVTDLTGKYVTTLDNGDGVQGLAFDGTTLYAALAAGTGTADSIGAIDASTITPTTTSTPVIGSLATGDTPASLALQSGKLYVSYNTTAATNPGAIGDFTLTPSVTFEPATVPGSWASAPDLAADPSNTGVLVAVLPGTNAAPDALAATFDTAVTPVTTKASQGTLGTTGNLCEFEHQIAVAPGGATFIVACGSPVNENSYNTSNLSVRTTYNTRTPYPGGVVIDTDGTVAVGTYGPQSAIYVYKAGTTTLLNVFSLGGSDELVAKNGLAWIDTASGSQLAAMEQSSGPFQLQVFDQPTLTRSSLTLTTPANAVIGKTLTLTGSLTLSNGATLSGTPTVTVTRTGPGTTKTWTVTSFTNGAFTVTDTPAATGKYTYTAQYGGDPAVTTSATATAAVTVSLNTATLHLIAPAGIYIGKSVALNGTLTFGTGSVAAGTAVTITRMLRSKVTRQVTVKTGTGGAFKLTDTPPVTGKYTYTAKYAGNSTTDAATVSHAVSVVLHPTALSVTTGATTFTYEPTVHVTAHLGATYRNRTVSIYAQQFGSKTRALLKTGRVNSRGELTVSYRAPHSVTFTVVFSGDAHYTAKTVTRPVYVRASVSESISGYYATTYIGGVLYRLFHSSDLLSAAAGVAPNKKGECVQFEVSEFYQGAWNFNVSTPCVSLDNASQAFAVFNLTGADLGFPYRVRADYMRSGQDTGNQNADSQWLYFEVES